MALHGTANGMVQDRGRFWLVVLKDLLFEPRVLCARSVCLRLLADEAHGMSSNCYRLCVTFAKKWNPYKISTFFEATPAMVSFSSHRFTRDIPIKN